jgi:malate dehydrogenase (oxaloacetate-decarboxylating)(NADP+)
MQLIYDYGFDPDNCFMCDTRGVIYDGRAKGMNPYKQKYANRSDAKKTLLDAFKGADIAIGLS